MTGQHEPL